MPDSDLGDESNFRGHVTQKAVVFNENDEILLVRSAIDKPWAIPGGRVQDGENADEALAREIKEETGMSVQIGQPVHTMTEVWFTDDGEPMFTVVYCCETNETDVELNHEHEEYEWASFEGAKAHMPIEPLVFALERAFTWRHQSASNFP